MDTRKITASLCYFSIFFAGFLIPAVVYFITNDYEVRYHAKKALISHILPFFSLFLMVILWLIAPTLTGLFLFGIAVAILYGLVIVYNVVKGIQVLLDR
ncbi:MULTISPECIES: DUF4870 domain-containing protein [Paenibacillus]|uniref:DUF4870 domain-containing protein n=1 Tax=Paenibacillus TaxID=44249 RepID=UPI0022B8B480|nr:DUF4870 domain-containing protein [Paenibacillus caseinilyticus]MCZ8522383.1 DUF4870 domain-containing protein [Paenibacillus caseinilyticus]